MDLLIEENERFRNILPSVFQNDFEEKYKINVAEKRKSINTVLAQMATCPKNFTSYLCYIMYMHTYKQFVVSKVAL